MTKCHFWPGGLLEVEVTSLRLKKCRYFWGMTENLRYFWGCPNEKDRLSSHRNWRTNNGIILLGPNIMLSFLGIEISGLLFFMGADQ